ncbi:MAG: DUF2867 domain-containing protein [Deltaproteobacteria bacterium]|nr:DUF2867 domain-containing protein [Deltaproteobacteria bacterium]
MFNMNDGKRAQFGARILDSRMIKVDVCPERAFNPIRRIGGETGWYYGNWLWRLRGYLDLMVGGVGLRPGRSDPEFLHPGDTVDFWRVECLEEGRKLRLRAEMKIPGRAWLEFEIEENGASSLIRQTAIFDPAGVPGLLYWYLLYPVHQLVFRGMLKRIGEECQKENKLL